MDNAALLLKITGDPTGAQHALSAVTSSAEQAVLKMQNSFHRVGNFLKGALVVGGVGSFLESSVNSAQDLMSLQRGQAQILTNQGLAQQYNIEGSKKQNFWYSKNLDLLDTQLALKNAANKADIVAGQNRVLGNKDIADYVSHSTKGVSNMKLMTQAAIDMAANMKGAGAGSGGVAAAFKMMNRVMTDPARRANALVRYGVSLSQQQIRDLHIIQATQGVYAARVRFIADINKSIGGVAEAKATPMQHLKADIEIIKELFGRTLIPLLAAFAKGLIPIIMKLAPVMNQLAIVMGQIGTAFGKTFAVALKALMPFFTFLATTVMPLVLQLLTPFMDLLNAVIVPLSKAFEQATGAGTPFAAMIKQMGVSFGKDMAPAIKAVGEAVKAMVSGGLMDALVQSFVALAPVMPNLVVAFSNLVIALAPLLTQAVLPMMVKMLQAFAWAAKVGSGFIKGLSGAVKEMTTGAMKPLLMVMGALAGAWFARSLFLAPIEAVSLHIRNLGGRLRDLKKGMSDLSSPGGIKGKLMQVWHNVTGFGKNAQSMATATGGMSELAANTLATQENTDALLKGSIPMLGGKKAGLAGEAESLVGAGGGGGIKGLLERFGKSGLGSKLGGLMTKIPMIGGLMEGGGMMAMLAPILPLLAGIAAAVALIVIAFKHWRGLLTGLKAIWHAISAAFMWVFDWIKSHWKLLGLILLAPFAPLILAITFIGKHWSAIWGGIKRVAKDVFEFFKVGWDELVAAVRWVQDAIIGVWDHIWGFIKRIGIDIKNFGVHAWDSLYNSFVRIANMIIRAYDNTLGWIPGMHVNTLHTIGDKPINKNLRAEAMTAARVAHGSSTVSGNNITVHSGAVVIHIHGNANHDTAKEVGAQVTKALKELHRNARAVSGR